MKKLICTLFCLAIIVGLAIPVSPVAVAADEVYFPDPILREAIRSAVGGGDITYQNLGQLDAFSYGGESDPDVTDLRGMEACFNLTHLWLPYNQISDPSPLWGLDILYFLDLSNNQISDTSELIGIDILSYLNLDNNQVSDLSTLFVHTDLQWLYLSGNQISDLSPLSSLTMLRGLYLSGNQISDLSPLVANAGLGSGDEVELLDNPLSTDSVYVHIPELEARGVTVYHDATPPTPTPTPIPTPTPTPTPTQATWSPMSSGTALDLRDVWGSSASDVFAVGDSGTILHYNGSSWSPMSSGTIEVLWAVWGSSSSDVFAVGNAGTILHYNGSSWSPMSSGTTQPLFDVWGSSSSDVIAVGASSTKLLYNGTSWNSISSGLLQTAYGVWGRVSLPAEIWAVGKDGTILRSLGGGWNWSTSGTQEWLYGVWGSSSSDVFAVGRSGTILHYDATSPWSRMSSGTIQHLRDVGGSSPSDVFAVGYNGTILHYNGSSWTPMSSGTIEILRGIWANSSSDVFAVGDEGTILHYATPTPTDNTPVGSPVVVDLGAAVVTFANVTGSGTTSAATTSANPAGPTPPNFRVRGSFVDVSTTASSTGLITVGVRYSSNAGEANLKLFHWDGAQWGNVTTSVDTVNNIVYGQVSDLSPFFIGEDTSAAEGGGCFIATSALGPDDSSVATLRTFRDTHLSANPAGRGFISAYYKLSPPVAEFIDDHPALKPVVRAALLPAVGVSEASGTELPMRALIAGAALVVSAFAALWARRRLAR